MPLREREQNFGVMFSILEKLIADRGPRHRYYWANTPTEVLINWAKNSFYDGSYDNTQRYLRGLGADNAAFVASCKLLLASASDLELIEKDT